MKKIGILAGTFDPIHVGHLDFAKKALDIGLEKVYFLVEPRPRRKQGVRSLEHRIAMVELAISDQADTGVIKLEQARFNIEKTLPALQSRFKGYEIHLLFGDDIISHIVNWPYIKELAEEVKLIIGSRHHNNKDLHAKLKSFEKSRNIKFDYEVIHPEKNQVSSSKIRQAIKRGESPAGLINKTQKYIQKNKLYSAGADEAPK